MARKRKRKKSASWQALKKTPMNPVLRDSLQRAGEDPTGMEIWTNNVYQVIVRKLEQEDGEMLWLSIKTHDRKMIRDWRDLQQIKNEIAGEEREGCEIFPAESRLVDTSNEFHLWVLPEGVWFPFGYRDRLVVTPEEVKDFNRELRESLGPTAGRARQRPWREGLTTGQSKEIV